MNALSNARHPGESFDDYRARRRVFNGRRVQLAARKMAHVSSQAVRLPAAGFNAVIDEDIRRGKLRDVATLFDTTGQPYRVGRTKGVTYRKPVAK